MHISERKIELACGRRNVAVIENDGPPLLLLHGVTRRWQCFLPILPALAQRHAVYALDFRGHGDSDRTDRGYRVIDYVEDAINFIREIIGSPTCVYGHSLGSMVAVATAASIPELVTGVVLEDPPFETMGSQIDTTPLRGYFASMKQFAASELTIPEIAAGIADLRMQTPGLPESVRLGDVRDAAWFRFAAKCLQKLDPRVIDPIAAGEWLAGYVTREYLSRVQSPALVLQAELSQGGMLTEAEGSEAERVMHDCVRVKFDCHHLIHWYETQALINATTEFLESL